MKREIKIELEELVEILEYEINNTTKWKLPSGKNELISTTDGHLTAVHTSSLEKWKSLIEKVLSDEKASIISHLN